MWLFLRQDVKSQKSFAGWWTEVQFNFVKKRKKKKKSVSYWAVFVKDFKKVILKYNKER